MAKRTDAKRLRPAPPVHNPCELLKTDFRTPDDVKKFARRGRKPAELVRQEHHRLSLIAASIMAGGGLEILGPSITPTRPPEGVVGYKPMAEPERAVRWIANEWNLPNRAAFYRLARTGLVRSLCASQCATPALAASERALQELAKLLPAKSGPDAGRPDRTDEIGPAFMRAVTSANGDDRSLLAHIRDEVDRILGRQPRPSKSLSDRLRGDVKRWMDRLSKVKGDEYEEQQRLLVRLYDSLGADV